MAITPLFVDPSVAYSSAARVVDGDTLAAVRSAYNIAAQNVKTSGRQAVLIEVLVRVAQVPMDFESNAPLTCGFGSGIEQCDSCQ